MKFISLCTAALLTTTACQAPPDSVPRRTTPVEAAEAASLRAEFLELHQAFERDQARWVERGGAEAGLPDPVEVVCPLFERLSARGSDEALVWVAANMPSALPKDLATTRRTVAALEACAARLDASAAEPWEVDLLEGAFKKGTLQSPAAPFEPVYRRLGQQLGAR